jgi:predicted transcriptional regulator
VTEDDLLAFIATSIGSVWAVELLLLLRRDPAHGWDADALVRELRSSAVVIDDALQRLHAAGLIIRDGSNVYRYRAASPQLNRLASELEEVYATKPMTVIRAIVSGRE